MEVSGQIHAPAILPPENEPPKRIGYEDGTFIRFFFLFLELLSSLLSKMVGTLRKDGKIRV